MAQALSTLTTSTNLLIDYYIISHAHIAFDFVHARNTDQKHGTDFKDFLDSKVACNLGHQSLVANA